MLRVPFPVPFGLRLVVFPARMAGLTAVLFVLGIGIWAEPLSVCSNIAVFRFMR